MQITLDVNTAQNPTFKLTKTGNEVNWDQRPDGQTFRYFKGKRQKWCTACEEWHDISCFNKDRRLASGHSSWCIEKHKEKNMECNKKLREAAESSEDGFFTRCASKYPLLTKEFLKSIKQEHCEIYGCKLIYRSTRGKGKKPDNLASLDRIITESDGGLYEPGNVRWISLKANRDRRDLGVWELERLLEDARSVAA